MGPFRSPLEMKAPPIICAFAPAMTKRAWRCLFMARAAARFRRARMPRPARHWHGSTALIPHEHSLYGNLEKPLPQGHFIMMSWQSRMKMSRSEEHTSELQSLMRISYAVFCLKKKKTTQTSYTQTVLSTAALHQYQ